MTLKGAYNKNLLCVYIKSVLLPFYIDRCKYFMNRQQNVLYNVECSWLTLVIKIRKFSLGIRALGIQFIVHVCAWSKSWKRWSNPACITSLLNPPRLLYPFSCGLSTMHHSRQIQTQNILCCSHIKLDFCLLWDAFPNLKFCHKELDTYQQQSQ